MGEHTPGGVRCGALLFLGVVNCGQNRVVAASPKPPIPPLVASPLLPKSRNLFVTGDTSIDIAVYFGPARARTSRSADIRFQAPQPRPATTRSSSNRIGELGRCSPEIHPGLKPLAPRPAPPHKPARGHVLAGQRDEGLPHTITNPAAPNPLHWCTSSAVVVFSWRC
jgi:hypothetical protein